jgi:hypothetical protein
LWMNLGSLVPLCAMALALVWLARIRWRARRALA